MLTATIMSGTRAVSLSDTSSSADSAGREWQDMEPDEELLSVVSFFDDRTFPDAKSMLTYCAEKHGFDFLATCKRLGLDFHGAVKLCNFGMSSSVLPVRPRHWPSPQLSMLTP